MPGKFVVKKGSTGKFRFNLVSTNGQVVATSEAYETKAAAMKGIRAVKFLAADALVEDLAASAPPSKATAVSKATAAANPVASKAAAPTPAGGAYGYVANVGLFGGPPERRGFGQAIPPGNAASASPSVELPAGGSVGAVVATDADGALAQYGPAVILCGKPPKGTFGNPPTGPIVVSTKGRTSVTSSASVKNLDAGPFTAGSVKSTASAAKSGVKGLVAVANGVVVTATDAAGNPKKTKAVPAKPAANLAISGKNAIGDAFKVVFNEQTKATDGTITVVGAHLYLLGPTAAGEVVIAECHARV